MCGCLETIAVVALVQAVFELGLVARPLARVERAVFRAVLHLSVGLGGSSLPLTLTHGTSTLAFGKGQ